MHRAAGKAGNLRNAVARFALAPLLCALFCASSAFTPARAADCSYQRAYAVNSAQLERVGDILILHVQGLAPAGGWTDGRLAVVPDDTHGVSAAYVLIGCAPPGNPSGGAEPLDASAYIISNPGRLQSIVIRASTNDLRLRDDTQL